MTDENDSKGRHTKIKLHNVILTMFVFCLNKINENCNVCWF